MIAEPVRKRGLSPKWQWIVIAITALVLLVLSSHWWLLYGRPVRGVVIDVATSKPLPDATVVVKWMGSLTGMHGSRSVCYHVALATTGKDGSFYIPFWWQQTYVGANPDWLKGVWTMTMGKPIEATAYKAAYFVKRWPEIYESGEDVTLTMEPFSGTTRVRLGDLIVMLDQQLMCEADDKTLIPVYRAAYEEGKSLAVSPEELKMADTLLTGLEAAQFGNSAALKRAGVRDAERLKQNRK